VRALLLLVAVGCGSAPATTDAGVAIDAALPESTFPGCAPTQGEVCDGHLCWVNPVPMEPALSAIGGGGCDYWLVGSGIYRLNGDTMTAAPTPPGTVPAAERAFSSVLVFPDQVWMSGPGTVRFDGKTYDQMDPIGANAMWGSSSDDIWFVRGFELTHWNGVEMTDVQPPDSPGSELYGTSANDVRVTTFSSQVDHWNGSAWTSEPGPEGALYRLWASGPDDWYAVGWNNDGAVIWRRGAGGVWDVVYMNPAAFEFVSIWGASADDIWVASGTGTSLVHFDGNAWSEVAVPAGGNVYAIHGTRSDDVVFVGSQYLARWNGSEIVPITRRVVELAPPEGRWVGVYAASANDAWFVGDGGTTAHWDGAMWQQARIAPEAFVTSLSGTASDDIWVAGATGNRMMVWHWDGHTWKSTDLGAPGELDAIHAESRSDVWAVGKAGAIFHFDGSWHRTPAPATTNLVSVTGHAGDAWAVGDKFSFHWNGQEWARVNSFVFGSFTAVWERASNDVYFGTNVGELYRFDGFALTSTTASLGSVNAIGGDATTMWVAGVQSFAYDHGTGLRTTSTPESWLAASFMAPNDGWIAGTGGAIMRYRP
jgi:hypothetical protein